MFSSWACIRFFFPQDVLTITPTIFVQEPGVGAKKETTFTEGYWPENASRPVIDAKGKVNLLQVCMWNAQRFFLYNCNTQISHECELENKMIWPHRLANLLTDWRTVCLTFCVKKYGGIGELTDQRRDGVTTAELTDRHLLDTHELTDSWTEGLTGSRAHGLTGSMSRELTDLRTHRLIIHCSFLKSSAWSYCLLCFWKQSIWGGYMAIISGGTIQCKPTK